MAAYKNLQRYVAHRGREFHFVSYEGAPADPGRGRVAMPPTWFLVNAGKRWAVMPQIADESDDAVDQRLIAWLDENVFAS
jgi:hypothetical protein